LRRVAYEKPADAVASPPWQSVEQVVAVGMPFRLAGESLPTSHVRTVTTTPKGQSVQMTIVSEQVPGGVISSWSTEADPSGRVLRRNYTMLVEWDDQVRPRRRLFRRRLERRDR
jgi:hypothetical protein